MKSIRILIAEDSPIFVDVLRSAVDVEFDMEVVGIAENGQVAAKMCADLKPDLVLMDIQMPVLDGLGATEVIMADSPTPILVITSDPFHGGVDQSFKALSAGALDLIAKPQDVPWPDPSRREFLRKIRLLSQVPVVRHMRGRRTSVVPKNFKVSESLHNSGAVVGIVASTGGPRALAGVVAALDAEFAAPILVVQHIMPGFSSHLAQWLDRTGALHVMEAESGMRLEGGKIYMAPAESHLELSAGSVLKTHDDPAVGGHRPSGDLLLESIARYAGPKAIGLVMSGMGSDGTLGLAAIRRAGGRTLVQDKDSCVVYGMPQSAIDLGVVDKVVKLDELAGVIHAEVQSIGDKQ